MKKVLIYSPGSFDIEVLQNVIHFYSNLGFVCIIKYGELKKKYKISRFIYLRDSLENKSLEMVKSEVCDLYDYSKTIDDFTLNHIFNCFAKVNYISLTKPNQNFGFNFIRAYHPVMVNLWARNLSEKSIGLIHIGSRKSTIRLNEKDYIYFEFEKILIDKYKNNDILMFGNGWKELDGKIASLNMSKVSAYYAKSRSTIGVLWDIQRFKTLNSRYFYAPLNGCILFCEENSNLLNIPGVYSYHEMVNFDSDLGLQFANDIQRKAILFWNKENSNLVNQLSLKLSTSYFVNAYNWVLSFLINLYFKLK